MEDNDKDDNNDKSIETWDFREDIKGIVVKKKFIKNIFFGKKIGKKIVVKKIFFLVNFFCKKYIFYKKNCKKYFFL